MPAAVRLRSRSPPLPRATRRVGTSLTIRGRGAGWVGDELLDGVEHRGGPVGAEADHERGGRDEQARWAVHAGAQEPVYGFAEEPLELVAQVALGV